MEYESAILIYDSSCSDTAWNVASNMGRAYVGMMFLYRWHVEEI